MKPAHAMHAAAGWGAGGAEVEAFDGCAVGVRAQDRAGEELAEVVRAAADVAADIEAGKYKTSLEAQAAFMKVIMEAHASAQANKDAKNAEAAGSKQEGENKAAPAK